MLILQYKSGYGIPATSWFLEHGGTVDDITLSINEASVYGGSLYTGGTSKSGTTSSYDAMISTFGPTGTPGYQNAIGGIENGDQISTVLSDGAGNFYASGNHVLTPFLSATFLIKYNASGVVQWQRYLSDNTNAFTNNRAAFDDSGNIVVVTSVGAGVVDVRPDILITKWNTSGTLIFQKAFGGDWNDGVRDVKVDSSGNIYILGVTESGSPGPLAKVQGLVLKLNSSGTLQWQITTGMTGASGSEQPAGIAIDTSGDLFIAGWSQNGTRPGHIMKMTSAGALVWSRAIDVDQINSIDIDGTNIYVTGHYDSSSAYIGKYQMASGSRVYGRRVRHLSRNIRFQASTLNSDHFYGTGWISLPGDVNTRNVLIASLPTDGTDTGTYGGDVIYESTGPSETVGNMSTGTGQLISEGITTYTSSTPTLTTVDLSSAFTTEVLKELP